MKKLSRQDKDIRGEAGVSKMILLIAVILIVSVVAGGLIQFGTELSGTAFNIGRDVRTYSSSAYEIIGVVIVDVDLDQDVDQVYLTVRLRSGSEALSLEYCTITMTSDHSHRADYQYSSSMSGDDADSFNVEKADGTDSGSGVSGLITDPKGEFSLASPVISEGTIVQIHLDLEAGFGTEAVQHEVMHVEIQSDTASPCYIDFGVPEGIPSIIYHLK
ncbi:MAG: hypothetical protein U9R75_01765 [Candidatus Thermoplasmatota archaeon]|nr:hypothetical protein [Candidatus Thermoplasmatota archaeon]